MEERQEEIDLFEILKALWEDRKFIGFIVAGITSLATAVSFLLPKAYTSESLITPVAEESGGGGISLPNLPIPIDRGGRHRNIKAVLESDYLMEKVVKDL
ncbi:MAG: Wzz/FepE/Etk N-terminal domain-containing protein, partial [Aquificaceae bacterium]|nr:Wzz/FepE/Etk N-terminal domain-containing protein [Aquificaceae bacterium]